KIEMIKKHLYYLQETKDEKRALLEMRRHTAWYLKGIHGSNKLKSDINNVKSIDEFVLLLDTFKKEELNES
ncbi:MAG: tRNA-dihydrouridine synthase, partial [Bacilli bacterium]|nr:tRNA-dihydrouridine synthase [Bacilli bacterium]